VLDISDPSRPIEVGSHGIGGYDLALHNGDVYVAGDDSGLSILRFDGQSIGGQVGDVNGRPFAGVTLTLSGGRTTTTDASGVYTFTSLLDRSYTLTPTLSGYNFYPLTRTITLPRDTNGNFTVLAAPVSATLAPGVVGTLAYTDTQGLPTRLEIPVGALTRTTTLTLAPTMAWDGGGLRFAGHAFDLTAAPAFSPPPGAFATPLPLTVRYGDADMRTITAEDRLTLLWWSGSDWRDAAQTCVPASSYTRNTAANLLRVPICRPGRYALFGPTNQVSLPLVSGR
jgi:hypothetical protein